MLEQLLMLAAAVTAAVVFVRTALGKVPFWANLSDSTQSIVLQLLAFLFGLFGAWAQGLNAFPFTDAPLGLIFTGLAAALGAEGIHVLLALIGVRAGVTGQSSAPPIDIQASSIQRHIYMPFL